MSGIITPGQSKLVLHNRSEPYELTYNIAKRWGNNKSRIVLISESGSNAQPVPQISQTFHFLNIIPRGAPIWKAFAQEPLLLSRLRVQSATLEEKGRRYVYIPVYICMDIYIFIYIDTRRRMKRAESWGLPSEEGAGLCSLASLPLTFGHPRSSLQSSSFCPAPVSPAAPELPCRCLPAVHVKPTISGERKGKGGERSEVWVRRLREPPRKSLQEEIRNIS